MKKRLLSVVINLFFIMTSSFVMAQKKLVVYSWSDYIDLKKLEEFKKKTGINLQYDVYDSNEILDSKLMAGNTGFDLVVPSEIFFTRQRQVNIYQPLDKSKLTNYKNLDPAVLKHLRVYDPDNQYAIPYLSSTTGVGYNIDKMKTILGKNGVIDSWDIVFKPENLAKFKQCGVAMLDSATDILPIVLHYLGKDPNSKNEQDHQAALEILKSIRPYITYFHSSKYITDLANGDVCIAIGWSGDVLQAQNRAEEAKNGVKIDYILPKEGSAIYFDLLAIPATAKNVEEAHLFLNYLLRPEVMAAITNETYYPNANKAADSLIDESLRLNENIYLTDEKKKKMFYMQPFTSALNRFMNRAWIKMKSGR